MPRILAIDWDRLEARALLVHTGPTGSSIAGAWSVSLSSAEGAALAPREIGARLGAVIGGAVSNNATTLVGVGRDQVQMVLLSLPPAPLEELPELVRFQAERELTSLGPESALDYIPLFGDATTPHQVLVAALSAGGVTEVRQLCEAVGVEPERITLRATAAASFVARRLGTGADEVTLVVNRLTDEADLTVLVGEQVVLVRTVRLPDPSEVAGRARALAGEIRRTIAAVRQQIGDRQVSRVILCGIAAEADGAANLAGDLGLSVDVFDVAANAPSGLARTGLAPESLARFAAVMGMALGEADRRPPVVDFLNVRRRAAERKFTRQHGLAVAAAAVVLFFLGLLLWKRSHDLSAEIARINAEIAAKQSEFKAQQFDKTLGQAASIEKWLATDVNWLDEFERLSREWRPETLDSKKYPANEDAVVSQLVAFRPPGNNSVGGRIAVQAVARNPQVVATLESRLRDKGHLVETGGGKVDNTVPGYLWSFPLTIDVVPAAEDREAAP
jgi:hypothetical protein